MATINGHRPSAETTRALLEAIAGGRRGEQLRATVASWNRGATREQIDEAFQEACVRAARWCSGQTMGEVYVWLRTTTHRQTGPTSSAAQAWSPPHGLLPRECGSKRRTSRLMVDYVALPESVHL
jgi:hypothetical protein